VAAIGVFRQGGADGIVFGILYPLTFLIVGYRSR
jgi:hypothetical protein